MVLHRDHAPVLTSAEWSVAPLPVSWQWSLLEYLPRGGRASADSVLHQEPGEAAVLVKRRKRVEMAPRLRPQLWPGVSNEQKRLCPSAQLDFWQDAIDRPHAWHEEEPL